jgi:uncharacterized protein YdeI (YjbR/CyaY-like superfamily)
MEITTLLEVTSREEWRNWLASNGQSERDIWLIFYKKQTGKSIVSYEEAVEEALCFGWIDGIAKRVDEEKHAQRFTPRKNLNNWSDLNKDRVRKLIAQGKMTDRGMATITFSLTDGE